MQIDKGFHILFRQEEWRNQVLRIVLIGELCVYNVGDTLVFDCVHYLLSTYGYDIQIKMVDFYDRNSKADGINLELKDENALACFFRLARKALYMVTHKNFHCIDELIWNLSNDKKRIYTHYRNSFMEADGIIVIGCGTLKCDIRANYAPYYQAVIDCATDKQVPVYLSAVGVESKYCAKDIRCKMFESCLNSDTLKIATTRDYTDEFLRQYIHNPTTLVEKISDSAVWAAETYGITKDNNSSVVGLGIISPNRFQMYGKKISIESYYQVCMEIINYLDENHVQWQIFNNGDTVDRECAEQLCRMIHKPIDSVLTPTNPEELVSIISGFKGIITSRLHSCIVSYSLGIPFTAIAWNNKLKCFSQAIKRPQWVVEDYEFNKETVVHRFELAMNEGYDLQHREAYGNTSLQYAGKYLQSIKEIKKSKQQELHNDVDTEVVK